jgi:dTDP-4-amino-4,6-dideoxygalactose transaminase
LDLSTSNADLESEIMPLWRDILRTAAFVGGEHVEAFEVEYAEACTTKHCVAVANGTDALRFPLIAMGLTPGDEVIAPANTFIATIEAISQAGGTPVLVDVEPSYYNLDPERIEAAITPQTRGIVPVHLYGQPADMDRILEIADRYDLWVIEDAAQSQLAEYRGQRSGSLGIAAGTSFYPGKNLGACGEAGAITTNSDAIASKVRMLRDHGQERKYVHIMEGYNGRCDALQAAALRVKLRHLPEWIDARRRAAARYHRNLSSTEIVLPQVAAGRTHTWHLFVIQIENRDQVADTLRAEGIGTGMHYPIPLYRQQAYTHLGLDPTNFPITDNYSKRLLSLPIFPGISDEQVDHVCDTLKEILK